MNNVIKFPVIAGVEIKTDDQQRFNLNALHKASGLGKSKQPNNWLRLDSTKELVDEILNSSDMRSNPIDTLMGKNGGTFAVEQLAVSYANWISPKFYLKVINTFIDYKKGDLQPVQPNQLSRFDILKMAMQAEEENLKLSSKVEEMTTQVEALNRIASFSDGSLCITNAAKDLQMRPKDLFAWLSEHKWIYKRTGGAGWIAYQEKLQQGVLEHKITVVSRTDGSEKTTEQVRITSKGLAKLAITINDKVA